MVFHLGERPFSARQDICIREIFTRTRTLGIQFFMLPMDMTRTPDYLT